jgi:hypothetical protein
MAASQDSDDELRTLLGSTTALRLEKLPIPGTTVSICCDTSTRRSRPYIPAPLRLQVFQSIHDVASRHQSNGEAGHRAFSVARRAKGLPHLGMCLPVQPRLYTAASTFPAHPDRPCGISSDVSGLSVHLTAVDCFTHWPEVVTIPDITADTVACALLIGWISCFSRP